MDDPLPENIEGTKRVTHRVEHSVNWGHVMLGAAAVMVVLYLSGGDSSEDDDGVDFNTYPSEGEVYLGS
jgi:type VI protein secretion system component VasF